MTTYTSPGSHTYTVPEDITEVLIKCWGAGTGTAGGYAEGVLDVSPGENLTVRVGGTSSGTSGGYNGGADAGSDPATAALGSGGAGASDVRQGGSSLSDRAIVAGGAGGDGGDAGDGSGGQGGQGGASTGGDGGRGDDEGTDNGGFGGSGGDQSSGGSGGAADDDQSVTLVEAGSAGSLGSGGAGGSSDSSNSGNRTASGGGGGGGLYGGGGGGASSNSSDAGAGGGAGGSNYTGGVSSAVSTQGAGNTADGQVEILAPVPNAPPNVRVSDTRETEIDIAWDDVDYETEYRVYLAESSGSTTVDYTLDTTVGEDVTSATITGLENGERYYIRVTAWNGSGESSVSAEVDSTTDLPPTEITSIDTSVENELTLSLNPQDNSSDGSIDMYRSTDGSLGSIVASISPGTTSWTDTTVLDGERYHYTARRVTDHAQADGAQQDALSLFPALEDVTVEGITPKAEIQLSWTDTIDNEAGIRVLYQLPDESTWREDADLAADSTAHTTQQLISPDPVSLKLEAYNEHTSSQSQTVETSTITPTSGRYDIRLVRSDDAIRQLVDRAEAGAFDGLEVAREHTALSQWDATIRPADYYDLEENWKSVTTEVLIYYDADLLFRGYFPRIEGRESNAETMVGGHDILEKLTRGETTVSYQATPTHDAIADYWANYTPFDATVEPPSPTEIVSDETVIDADSDSEWSSRAGLGATDPFHVSSGRLEQTQTAFTKEAESASTTGTDPVFADELSGGEAVEFSAPGDALEFSFTLDHEIPASEFALFLRYSGVYSGGSKTQPIRYKLDGTDLGDFQVGTGGTIYFNDLIESGNLSDPDGLSEGTHTFRMEMYEGNPDDDGNYPNDLLFRADVIAPADGRFNYTVDNSISNGERVDGPEWFPTTSVRLVQVTKNSANITDATVSSTWSATTGDQAIEFSNDGGNTWETIANAESGSVSFGTYGTNLDTRLVMTGTGTQSGTPTDGVTPMSVDALSVSIDGNDLSVLDDVELRNSHFRNLVRLHEFAGYRFAADYDENRLLVDSFPRGTTATLPDRSVDDRKRVADEEGYANRVVVEGKQRDDGTYPRAVQEANAEIAAKGETITRHIKDLTLETDAACESRARSALGRLTSEDELTGTEEVTPTDVRPGYSYTIDAWSETLALERVSYQAAFGNASGRLQFAGDPALVERTSEQRREIARTQESL